VTGLELGAFSVVIQTLLSGITELPFGVFTALMLPIHLAIGLVEGIVTAAVLCYVYKMRPEIIESAQHGKRLNGVSVKKVAITLAILAVVIGGALSLLASTDPDGLEWAISNTIEQTAGNETELEAEGSIFDEAARVQENVAFLADYTLKTYSDHAAGTSVAGITGAVITCVMAAVTGLIITIERKSKREKPDV
jgi:cobalt/nickel transport system permease protein